MDKETHITTTQHRAMLPIEEFKKELVGDYQKQVTNFFMGDKERAMKFMSAVVYSTQKTPKLLECDRTSLMQAFMTCAEYRLYPSSASGEAYVLPYSGKAQFQLGYQGIITLLYRAGVQTIETHLVYEKDTFEYEEGLEPKLIHKFDAFATKEERGKVKGVYAVAMVNGQKMFKVMGMTDVLKFKNLSQAKDSPYSPWNSDKDPEFWMARKTCIKQLAKILPKNDEVMQALSKDNEDSVVNLHRANLDAGGPAVGAALHVPASAQTSLAPERTNEEDQEVTYVNLTSTKDDSEAELNKALKKEAEGKK